MGVARIFIGGKHFFKKIFKKLSKSFRKIFKIIFNKFSKKFKKYSTNFQKNYKKISKNFQKIFLRKLLKMDYFSIIFSQLNKWWGQFLRVRTKNAICRNFLRKFSKIIKSFFKKMRKCIILADFSQNLRNNELFFAHLD